MPTKKQQLSRRRRVIKFIVVPVLFIALFLFGAAQLIRVSYLENEVRDMGMQNFLQMANNYYGPLPIDPLHKQAYIPELNIVLPYDNQVTSTMRYFVYQDDPSGSNGVVQLGVKSEMQKTAMTSQGVVWSGCQAPFHVSVGNGDAQGDMKLVSQKTLQDGRKMTIYENSTDTCGAFLSSANGGTIIDMLQKAESY
jgi:hypothetical protein